MIREKSKRHRRLIGASLGVTALLLTVSACSSGGGSKSGDATGAGSAGGGSKDITVVYTPIIDFAPAKVAAEQGFFTKQGLNAKLVQLANGPQELSLLLNGQLEFGSLPGANLIALLGQGQSVKVLPIGVQISDKVDTASLGLIAAADGKVKSIKDLAGKTIAENALGSAYEFGTKAMLAENGVDPSKVRFVALPYASQVAAVKAGRVDAAISDSPFFGQAIKAGMAVLGYPQSYLPDDLKNVYFTTASFAAKNPTAVTKFVAAMKEANTFANNNRDAIQTLTAKAAGTPVELSPRVPTFINALDGSYIDQWAVLYKKYGKSLTSPIPAGDTVVSSS